jgi:hypothetical protein
VVGQLINDLLIAHQSLAHFLAVPGSDLDSMSLLCAIRNGYKIDRSQRACTKVMLADETVTKTVGQVSISSFEIAQCSGVEMTFNILPGLPRDVIFGVEFVEQVDLFNICSENMDSGDSEYHWLNTLINLGPVQTFLSNMWRSKASKKMPRVKRSIRTSLRLRNIDEVQRSV